VLKRYWYSTRIISKGRIHNAHQLPGFIAQQSDARVGLVLYEISNHECEIVSLNRFIELSGAASLLVDSVKSAAIDANCRRIWIITTNDNTQALRFYQRQGFFLAALYPNAIQQSRKLKPEIPTTDHDGIPIRDELEREMPLQ
jgi:GNAT superfamily N-acetyltransferase